MSKVLFGIDSYFQLIIATNLRTTIYSSWDADIVIYNSVPSAKKIYDNLKKQGLYQTVYLADTVLTKCGGNYSFIEKIPKYFVYFQSLVTPRWIVNKAINSSLIEKYDAFIFNGHGALPECIFNTCLKNNDRLKCYRFEDGYASYFAEFGKKKGLFRIRFENVMRFLFGNKNIEDYIDGYYFEEPELVLTELPYKVLQAPKFSRDNKELIKILNDVFDYNPYFRNFHKKIYLFEDGRLFFDKNDEEIEIVSELIKFIPLDNITIKMHPRRKDDRFQTLNVEVMKESYIPWEIIQLNCDFSNRVFISAASSSVFSSDVYFGDKCYKVLLYKCMKTPPSIISEEFEEYVNAYIRKYGKTRLFIPESYHELKEVIVSILQQINTMVI